MKNVCLEKFLKVNNHVLENKLYIVKYIFNIYMNNLFLCCGNVLKAVVDTSNIVVEFDGSGNISNLGDIVEDVKEQVQEKVEETQEQIQKKVEETQEQIQKKVEDTQEQIQKKVEETQEQIQKKVEDVKEQGQEKLESVQEQVQENLESVQEQVKEQVEQVKEQAQEKLEEVKETKEHIDNAVQLADDIVAITEDVNKTESV